MIYVSSVFSSLQTGIGAPQNLDRDIAQSRAPASQFPNHPSPTSSGTHLTYLFSLTNLSFISVTFTNHDEEA